MAVALLVPLGVAGCVEEFTGTELRSEATQETVGPAAVRSVSQEVTALGADVLRTLAARDAGDVAVAPGALAVQLSMVAAGAATSSATALDALLGGVGLTTSTAGRATIEGAVSVPDGRGGTRRSPERSGSVSVETAIALWIQRGPTVAEAFLDDLAVAHGTGVREVDFRSDPEGARAAMNLWTSGATNEAVAEVAPGGSVTAVTRLLSTAAQVVQAPWLLPFDVEATQPGTFTTASGEVVEVPTMVVEAPIGLRWGAGPGWQAVGLPYLGRELMVVVAIADPGAPPLTSRLDADLVTGMIDALRPRPLTVRLPRFSLDETVSLSGVLADLGAGVVFDTDLADLTVAAPAERLALSDVLQAIRLDVTEEGSGGSAATVTPGDVNLPPTSREVVVDRPFLLMVLDVPSRIPVLLAEIVDPS